MNVEIRPIDQKKEWETFISSVAPPTFLHTWSWGDFQELIGTKARRLGVYSNGSLAAVALVLSVRAKRGNFLLCPHGPIIGSTFDPMPIISALTKNLIGIAKDEKSSFIRIAPILLNSEENRAAFHRCGYRPAPIHVHPELSWMLDIRSEEADILKAARKTTRQAIRKSTQEGVSLSIGASPADVEAFWTVYGATVKRQHFTPFSKDFFEREREAFGTDGRACIITGSINGEPVSSAFIVFDDHAAYYHHGASTQAYPKIPPSHAVLWGAIMEAKRRGLAAFNFWGIAPDNRPRHPWAGLTLFKKGFGGYQESYVHAQDYPIRGGYWINWVIETIRKYRRGL